MKAAFAGSGKVTRRSAVQTAEDALANNHRLVISVGAWTTKDSMTASRFIAEWAFSEEHPYEVAVDPSFTPYGFTETICDSAQKVHKTSNISRLLSDGDSLYLAWNDDDDCMRALMTAARRFAPVYDLTNNNEEIILDDDEDSSSTSEPEQTSNNAEVMRRVRRILEKAMGEVEAILSEHILPNPKKNRRSRVKP